MSGPGRDLLHHLALAQLAHGQRPRHPRERLSLARSPELRGVLDSQQRVLHVARGALRVKPQCHAYNTGLRTDDRQTDRQTSEQTYEHTDEHKRPPKATVAATA
jgi:hypothetical protein